MPLAAGTNERGSNAADGPFSSTCDLAGIDRLAEGELDPVPVRILDDAEVTDDRSGVAGALPQETVRARDRRDLVHLATRAEREAEVMYARTVDLPVCHRDQDEDELRILRALREPYHVHA